MLTLDPLPLYSILHMHQHITHMHNNKKDLDALIIPGGFAPDYWRRDKRFVQLVKTTCESGKPVAAICHGPWMLCSARVLQDRRVTCFHSIKDDVINAG